MFVTLKTATGLRQQITPGYYYKVIPPAVLSFYLFINHAIMFDNAVRLEHV